MVRFSRNSVLLVFLLFFMRISNSQERIITGQVTTLKKIAVVNAEIIVSGTKTVVFTDTIGRFKISCLPKDKIKISAKGFNTKKIKIDEKTKEISVNLKFKPSDKNLDVAIGYGHIKANDKSYAITSIKNDDGRNSRFAQYSNMIDLIIDSSPSITVKDGGIIIRGEGSLYGSNSALILVNGNQINMSQLSAFQPLDVKSVDILKGSSTAIYGARGANGVILITTKAK